jgi:uncharacterized repeat protein (TIGR01451 family)
LWRIAPSSLLTATASLQDQILPKGDVEMNWWNVTLFLVSAAAFALGLPVGMPAQAAADLTVQLSRIGARPVFTGTKIKFAVDIFNHGNTDADNVSVVTKLPPAWSFVQAGQSGCTIGITPVSIPIPHFATGDGAEQALCAVGSVPARESRKLIFLVKVPTVLTEWLTHRAVESLTFTSTAVADPDNVVQESNEQNNVSTLETTVQTAAELVPEWSGLITAAIGLDLLYHARVRNSGDREATNVSVRVDIPGLMQIVHVGDGNMQCPPPTIDPQSGNPRLDCIAAVIGPGSEATIIIKVRLNPLMHDGSSVQLMITADPAHSVPERDETNNYAPLLVTVLAPADLQLSGTTRVTDDLPSLPFFPPSADPFTGQTIADLTLTIHNAGPAASAATTVNVAWAAVFSGQDSLCPAGTFLNGDVCAFGQPSNPLCFGTAVVPTLQAGETTTIHCRAIKPWQLSLSHLVEFGSVTLDPNNVVRDPNRNNNHMLIPH